MYKYEIEKYKIFTEGNQKMFLKIRDEAHRLLKIAGAFSLPHVTKNCGGGEGWTMMACVDRLVELGEIIEITPYHFSTRVFVLSNNQPINLSE